MKLRALALLLVTFVFEDARPECAPELYPKVRLAFDRGEFKLARALGEEGMLRFGKDLKWNELFASVTAEALSRTGRSEAAAALLANTPRSGDPEATIRRLMAHGYLAALAGGKTDEEYRKAAILAARLTPTLQAEIAMRRATPAFNADNADEIERFSLEALKSVHPGSEPYIYANARTMLAAASFKRNDYQQAIERGERALRFARSVGAMGTASSIVGNLGWSYMQLGDTETARLRYQDALMGAEKQANLRTQATWLANIANVYVTEQQLAEALPYAQRAVAIARGLDDPKRLLSTLVNLAEVEIELGRYADAKKHNDEALSLPTDASKHYAMLNAARIEAVEQPHEALKIFAELATLRDLTLRWHAQVFMAALYQRLGQVSEARNNYEAALETADGARVANQPAEAYLFAFETLLIRFYDRYIDLLLDAGYPREALLVADRSRARTLRQGIGLPTDDSVAPEALARAHNAAILFYWLAPRRSRLWVVTPSGVFVKELPPAARIEKELLAYRREILAKESGLESRRASSLFEMLVRPALAHTDDATRFIVIGDGRLNELNPESLVVEKPRPHYWVEDATVSYAPALASIPRTTQRRLFRDARALLIGDVPAQSAEFPALPYAGQEIERVARHFDADRCQIVTGSRAIPSAYINADLQRLTHLHFAAHATANARTPLASSVILAGGRLSGDAIVGAKLPAAELVTVSSCSTTGRRSYAGEGPVGLAWAFLRAGAKRVVASQWDVSDAATTNVMDGMYRELAEDRAPADALRVAKLDLIRARGKHAKPYYWAPFILYGAP